MPSPLNLALVAALAAGAVVAGSAIGEPGDRSGSPSRARTEPVLIAPTRGQAIDAAAAFRARVNEVLGRRLGVTTDRLLAAERAIVDRQLSESVDHRLLSADQRDALLACFDDPKGCDRNALPVLNGGLPRGAIPLPVPMPHVVIERPRMPRSRIPRPALVPQPAFARCPQPARRRTRRPVLPCLGSPLAEPARALAKELSLGHRKVAAALRGTLRELSRELTGPEGPPADPDGVSLGVPLLLAPFPGVVLMPSPPITWTPPPAPPPRPRRP